MKCKLCEKEYGRTGGRFNRHLREIHNIDTYVDYLIRVEYNNIKPVCKCGCGKETNFHNNSFKEYYHGHNAIKYHKEKNKLKPNDEILKMYESGRSGIEISKYLNLEKLYVYKVLKENSCI